MKKSNVLVVESAVALTKEQLTEISKQLKNTVSGITKIQARVNPGLIGGLRLRFQGKVVDMTLRNRLLKLEEHISQHVN